MLIRCSQMVQSGCVEREGGHSYIPPIKQSKRAEPQEPGGVSPVEFPTLTPGAKGFCLSLTRNFWNPKFSNAWIHSQVPWPPDD